MIYAICLKIVGSLLLIVATGLVTIKIPSIDKTISNLEEKISKFKDSRIITSQCTLAYGKDFVKRRIELFERNQIVLHNGDEKLIQELGVRALDDTIKLATQWASLLAEDKAEEFTATTKQKVTKIVNNETMPLTEKIDAVEVVWKENMDLASTRLESLHGEWRANEAAKKVLVNKKENWRKGFILAQIFGLILLAAGETIEKIIPSKAS